MSPTVSFIVTCYNYGRYLRECVKSILTQEGVEVRVLILDDCSKDNSEEVGRQFKVTSGDVIAPHLHRSTNFRVEVYYLRLQPLFIFGE